MPVSVSEFIIDPENADMFHDLLVNIIDISVKQNPSKIIVSLVAKK